MRKPLSGIVFAFFLTLSLVGFSSLAAHAATISRSGTPMHAVWTHTTKKVIPGPQAWCAEMIKENPELASNPQGCNIVIVSRDTLFQSNSSHSGVAQPTSCPRGQLNHDVKENSNFGLSGAEMRETFNYSGNCSDPGVSNQNCTFNMWAYAPYSGIQNTYCGSWTGSNSTTAEGDYYISAILGAGGFSALIQSTANRYVRGVADSSNF
ncbi:MAG: hypothetical protein ABI406_19160 [Ktedonobacteraceae bacterium]